MSGKTVLVLGGYGFFGRRLCARLVAMDSMAGATLVVAGRSASAAEAWAQALQKIAPATCSITAARLDTEADDFAAALAALQPGVVVHTAGPFQAQDYRVARACIGCGAHYIDLADGRAFVAGIGALNDDAIRAGVAVISGASSVPALSSAVVDRLAASMARIDAIDIGISPGNRTDRGLATVRGILGYCGRPIASHQAVDTVGWLGTWRHRYPAPVGERLLSPCDVPDLDVLHGRYPGGPAIRFGAGLELRFMHRAMNLMAWTAQRGWVRNWARFAPLLKHISEWFIGWGSDAGAMHVQVRGGDAASRPVVKTWHLIAAAGDGPSVPTLAAAALVRRVTGGAALAAGASACVGLLTLDEILAEARGLAIVTSESESAASAVPIFRAALGDAAFARLDPAVRQFHSQHGRIDLQGRTQVLGPESLPARWLARLAGAPMDAAEGAIRFTLEASPDGELWVRSFPGARRPMRSTLRLHHGDIVESLGPIRLRFAVGETDGALVLQLHALHILGWPCPRWLLPQMQAREHAQGSRLHFAIELAAPWIGRISDYRGYLELASAQQTEAPW